MPGKHVSPIGVAWVGEVTDAVKAHNAVPRRALTPAEIAKLEANGNRVVDGKWDAVVVRMDGRAFDAAAVQRCTLIGAVELGTDRVL